MESKTYRTFLLHKVKVHHEISLIGYSAGVAIKMFIEGDPD